MRDLQSASTLQLQLLKLHQFDDPVESGIVMLHILLERNLVALALRPLMDAIEKKI